MVRYSSSYFLQNHPLVIKYCNFPRFILFFFIIDEKLFFTLSLFYRCSD
ncbi:hypothetical protein CKO_01769 [Citrobacter koseri ATCC BAA-895]|uniref:Uncharacterized protein n=1 Tax=Citrobacter koseri (strain ATCC BAA-895 / CDC 4225-83 / SGSC4696) TaxID=290338 RepID=A8AHD5_CITK8|nr:hypothetical protein CKO_01769 [Citrobacter koseri ATCC BAA-895]